VSHVLSISLLKFILLHVESFSLGVLVTKWSMLLLVVVKWVLVCRVVCFLVGVYLNVFLNELFRSVLIHTISFVVTSFQPHSCIEKTIAYSSFILISNMCLCL
jgi:hypothetical protein